MTRDAYIAWHKEHYRVPPKPYLLEKYYPEDRHEPTEKDRHEFWEGMDLDHGKKDVRENEQGYVR